MQKIPQPFNKYLEHRKIKTIKEFWQGLNKKQKILFVVCLIFALLILHVFTLLFFLGWWILSLLSSNFGGFVLQSAIPLILNKFSQKTSPKEAGEYSAEHQRFVFVRKNMSSLERMQVLEEAQKELEQMIGLNPVKKQIKTLKALFQVENERKQATKITKKNSMNLVFSGPPGTGKTTVARLLGDILFGIGILEVGHVVEVDRSNLVANYVGQTASRTKEFLELALGGVLFVDEAYTLLSRNSNDFGSEAVDTILKFMEDNRGKLCIVIAGYSENMNEFLSSNPGLLSRFNKKVNFENYNAPELYEIFDKFSTSDDMAIAPEAQKTLNNFLVQVTRYADTSFGNGRFVRNFYEVCKEAHALRMIELEDRSLQDLNTFLVVDFENAVQQNV